MSQPARGMNLIQCIRSPGQANEECGECVAVLPLERCVRSGLVVVERKTARRAAAGAADFADERELVILVLAAEFEAMVAMLPMHNVIDRDGIVDILRIVVFTDPRIWASDKNEPREYRSGAVRNSQRRVPVRIQIHRARLIVIVGAVGAESQRVDQTR